MVLYVKRCACAERGNNVESTVMPAIFAWLSLCRWGKRIRSWATNARPNYELCECVSTSRIHRSVFDISSTGQIPNPSEQKTDSIDITNTNKLYLSHQVHSVDLWIAPFSPIELSLTDAAPIQDETVDAAQADQIKLPETPTSNVEPELEGADSETPDSPKFIDQCVWKKVTVIESTPPLAALQPYDTDAVENAHFDWFNITSTRRTFTWQSIPAQFECTNPLIAQAAIFDVALHNPRR